MITPQESWIPLRGFGSPAGRTRTRPKAPGTTSPSCESCGGRRTGRPSAASRCGRRQPTFRRCPMRSSGARSRFSTASRPTSRSTRARSSSPPTSWSWARSTGWPATATSLASTLAPKPGAVAARTARSARRQMCRGRSAMAAAAPTSGSSACTSTYWWPERVTIFSSN